MYLFQLSCALAFCTPLVPIDYWKAALNAFQNNEEFPDPVEFASLINNKMAKIGKVDVAPNPMRTTCFKNLTFVHFTSKQHALYKRMIKLAGIYRQKQINLHLLLLKQLAQRVTVWKTTDLYAIIGIGQNNQILSFSTVKTKVSSKGKMMAVFD